MLKFKRRSRGATLSTSAAASTSSQVVEVKLAKGATPPKAAASAKTSALEETIAGGIARAGSQSTIHPIDTVKVRMQAGTASGTSGRGSSLSGKDAKTKKNLSGVFSFVTRDTSAPEMHTVPLYFCFGSSLHCPPWDRMRCVHIVMITGPHQRNKIIFAGCTKVQI